LFPVQEYCNVIETDNAWGGEPEIIALSRALKKFIQVIRAKGPAQMYSPDGEVGLNP
jgi:hypothetical protein